MDSKSIKLIHQEALSIVKLLVNPIVQIIQVEMVLGILMHQKAKKQTGFLLRTMISLLDLGFTPPTGIVWAKHGIATDLNF